MLFLFLGSSTIQEALELASHIRDMRSTYVRPASKNLGVRQAQIEVPNSATQSDSDVTALKHWVRYFVKTKTKKKLIPNSTPTYPKFQS